MRTPGPRTLASVFAVVSHFPSKGSRRLSSGEGKGAPNTLVCSSVIGRPLSTNLEEQPGEAWRPVEQTLHFIEIETPWRPAPLVPMSLLAAGPACCDCYHESSASFSITRVAETVGQNRNGRARICRTTIGDLDEVVGWCACWCKNRKEERVWQQNRRHRRGPAQQCLDGCTTAVELNAAAPLLMIQIHRDLG